jgi:hypothetical protein
LIGGIYLVVVRQGRLEELNVDVERDVGSGVVQIWMRAQNAVDAVVGLEA